MSWEQYRKYYSADYVREYCKNTSLEERNAFSDDVNIMVIGHLTHVDVLIDFYKGIKNVLFVVDNTEEQYKVDALIQNGFEVITFNVPESSGFGNVNKQCGASKLGAEHLNTLNRNYCIRMRSDQIILQLHKFINNFKFDKLGFLAYVNSEGGYLMDYCISGPTLDMMDAFDYYEDDAIHKAAEKKIVETFLAKRGLEVNSSYDYLKDVFYFMTPTLAMFDINFLMIKQNYHDWTVAIPLQPNLYFHKLIDYNSVETNFPIAYDSPDHIRPHGTAYDNSTNYDFVNEITSYFNNEPFNFLDLGCSGGQLVVDFYNRGNFSIGLEGSDYSLNIGRANWGKYGNKILFTSDVTKPYKILYGADKKEILFDIVTAWEVVEHIKYDDLSFLFENINNVLKDNGIFLASIAMHPDGELHQTVKTKEEWITEIFPEVLKNTNLVVKEYPFQHWVRGGSQSFHIMLQKIK